MSPVTIFGGGCIVAGILGNIAHRRGAKWVAAPLFFAAIALGIGGIVALVRQLL